MEEDPRSKKLARRIITEFSDLSLVEKGVPPQSDVDRITKILMEELDIVDSLCFSGQVTETVKETVLKNNISSQQLAGMADSIASKKNDSLFGTFIRAMAAFSAKNYQASVKLLTGNDEFARIDDALDILKVSCYNIGDYSDACVFLSRSGRYDEVLFEGLKKSRPSDSVLSEIRENAVKFQDSPEICKIYSFVSGFDKSDRLLLSLARCLINTGDVEDGKAELGRIGYEDSDDHDFLKEFIDLCFDSQEYNHGYRAAKLASSAFPDSTEFEYLKATGLYYIGREDESLELLEHIVKGHPDFEKARTFLGDIYYKAGNYSDFVEVSAPIRGKMEGDLEWMLKYITAEINASDLDGAIRDIRKLESIYPENIEVLRMKLDVQILINDTNGAFTTSRKIFDMNRNDLKGREYFLDELYERHEYEEFLKHLDEYGSDAGYEGKKLASLIFLENFDAAVAYSSKNTETISDDNVLDALYFVVRDDEVIRKFLDILKSDGGSLPLLVLKSIQGIKIVWKEDILGTAEKSSSLAIAWIMAKSTINFKDRVKPELISNLISRPRFNVINNLIDAIFLIYSGRVTDDMTDSRRFFYPLTEALIGAGDFINAERKIQNAFDPKYPDAFYFYLKSRIDLAMDDAVSAGKNIERAMERLTNAQFLVQKIRVMIKSDDVDGILSVIDRIHRMESDDSICYEELYSYITRKNDQDVRKSFIDKFEGLEIKNIWLERLQRDKMAGENDLDGATRVSRIIVVSKSKTPEDIRTHAEILKASSRENEREEFLESVEPETEDPMIDVWLGDSSFLRKDYETALSFYRKALEKNEPVSAIRNFPEALIESDLYEEAEQVIRSLPGGKNLLLLKLYHRMGRINDIVKLLENLPLQTREDEEVIKYISRILWINRQIRDTLISLFNQSRNLTLGNIIVDRMLESRDFIAAEKVMRTIMKDYPDDVDNMRRLAELLYETKHPTEASNILLKAFKMVESKDDGVQILNTVLRIYYETANYPEIKKLYTVNTEYVNQVNIQWIVRSFIETYDFDMADRIIGFYHGKVIPEDTFHELIDEMNTKKEFLRTQEYAGKIFDTEFRIGRVLRSEEVVSIAEIPLPMVEDIYHFIDSEEYYREEDEPKYEMMTRDVFKKIVRKTNIESIIYVKINVIYHSLPRKDVILAKNLYIYIKKCLRKRRSPMLNNKEMSSLLKSALKMGLHREPLEVSYSLNVGINEAMDIITLMEYVSNLNR